MIHKINAKSGMFTIHAKLRSQINIPLNELSKIPKTVLVQNKTIKYIVTLNDNMKQTWWLEELSLYSL